MLDKSKIKIATHNGKFHPDDIFAVATLSLVLEKDHEIEIVRTRDPEIISLADYVVDVGGIYDPSKNRFDHHQKDGAGKREGSGIPYASFGLVWKEYGQKIFGEGSFVDLANKIDQKLVAPVDAHDNGIEVYTTFFEGISPYTINDVFSAYRTTWKEDNSELDNIFLDLVIMAKQIITREVKHAKDKKEANEIVAKIYEESPDKRLIILDRYYPADDVLCPYKDTRLVIFPDDNGGNWMVKVVEGDGFNNHKFLLPTEWAGLRDDDLVKVTGVTGAIFCHRGRFMAVASSKDMAIELANKALQTE